MKTLNCKMLWVWNYDRVYDGDPERMVQVALEHGVRALAFKHDDRGHPFLLGLLPDEVRRFKAVCQGAGVAFGLWGYHYGSNLEREARVVELALGYEPDFYIIDWEAEFEQANKDRGSRVAFHLFDIAGTRDRHHPDVGLFHAPLAQPRYHYPWMHKLFQNRLDGMLPQIYHRAMGLQSDVALQLCYEDYANYGLMNKPIYPAGQAYDVPAQEMLAWGARAVKYGAKGLSWWSFEHIGQASLEAIRDVPLGGEMRRANGLHPDFTSDTILSEGLHQVSVRVPFGLLATDERVVLDLEVRAVSGKAWPVVIVRDAGGAYAGYLDADKPRDQVAVYITATGSVSLEVRGGRARVPLFGILEAG